MTPSREGYTTVRAGDVRDILRPVRRTVPGGHTSDRLVLRSLVSVCGTRRDPSPPVVGRPGPTRSGIGRFGTPGCRRDNGLGAHREGLDGPVVPPVGQGVSLVCRAPLPGRSWCLRLHLSAGYRSVPRPPCHGPQSRTAEAPGGVTEDRLGYLGIYGLPLPPLHAPHRRPRPPLVDARNVGPRRLGVEVTLVVREVVDGPHPGDVEVVLGGPWETSTRPHVVHRSSGVGPEPFHRGRQVAGTRVIRVTPLKTLDK